MKRYISAVLAFVLVPQVVSVSTFATPLDDGKFKPAIPMKDQIETKEMSEEELQRIYAKFMEKVESDIKAQKELVDKKRTEEEQLKEKTKKAFVKELEKISALSKEEDIAKKMSTQSRELINAPYDLDAEVINAQISGYNVILTWMPSEGEDGYKIYQQIGSQEPKELGTSTTEKFEFTVNDEIIGDHLEINYTVKAYKGSQESGSSVPLTIVFGNQPLSENKTLQNNCVWKQPDCFRRDIGFKRKYVKSIWKYISSQRLTDTFKQW